MHNVIFNLKLQRENKPRRCFEEARKQLEKFSLNFSVHFDPGYPPPKTLANDFSAVLNIGIIFAFQRHILAFQRDADSCTEISKSSHGVFYRIIKMQVPPVTLLLLAGIVTSVASTAPRGSEFVAAVYEHAFIRAANRTAVLSQQEAVAIVMRNMDIYETQMKKAKEQVLFIMLYS